MMKMFWFQFINCCWVLVVCILCSSWNNERIIFVCWSERNVVKKKKNHTRVNVDESNETISLSDRSSPFFKYCDDIIAPLFCQHNDELPPISGNFGVAGFLFTLQTSFRFSLHEILSDWIQLNWSKSLLSFLSSKKVKGNVDDSYLVWSFRFILMDRWNVENVVCYIVLCVDN